jgi:hypothetical protein
MEEDVKDEEGFLLVKVSQNNLGERRNLREFSGNQGDLS